MQRLRYAGKIPEIQGQYFEVPPELSGKAACEYIELSWEIQQVDEQLRRDAEAAANAAAEEPIAQDITEEPKAGEPAEAEALASMRSELERLRGQIDTPDVATLVSAQSSLNQSIQSLHTQTTRAAEESARIEKLAETAKDHLDLAESFHRKIQQERKVILNALKMEEMKVAEREALRSPGAKNDRPPLRRRRIQNRDRRQPPQTPGEKLMPKKGEYTGPKLAPDSTLWMRNFAGRYQQIRASLHALSLEAENKRPQARQNEQKEIEAAIESLDAAFAAMNTRVVLEEDKRDPLAEPTPRGACK